MHTYGTTRLKPSRGDQLFISESLAYINSVGTYFLAFKPCGQRCGKILGLAARNYLQIMNSYVNCFARANVVFLSLEHCFIGGLNFVVVTNVNVLS